MGIELGHGTALYSAGVGGNPFVCVRGTNVLFELSSPAVLAQNVFDARRSSTASVSSRNGNANSLVSFAVIASTSIFSFFAALIDPLRVGAFLGVGVFFAVPRPRFPLARLSSDDTSIDFRFTRSALNSTFSSDRIAPIGVNVNVSVASSRVPVASTSIVFPLPGVLNLALLRRVPGVGIANDR
jgi:hypothetical protein